MRGWMFRWLLNILAIILTAVLLPGFEPTLWGIIIGSIFLGIINAVIRPILIFLTLPLNILSLGLFHNKRIYALAYLSNYRRF